MIYLFSVENVYERYSPWDVECEKPKKKDGITVRKYNFSGHADYGFTQVIEEIEEEKDVKYQRDVRSN